MELTFISKGRAADRFHNQLADGSTWIQGDITEARIDQFQRDGTFKARVNCRRGEMTFLLEASGWPGLD